MSKNSSSFFSKVKDVLPMIFMGFLILAVQLGALWLSSNEYITEQPVFENPESVGNAVYYIVILLVFSAIVVYAVKKSKTGFIRGVVYLSITVTFFYVISSIIAEITTLTGMLSLAAAALSLILAVILYKYPEWYVIDIAGIVISVGACAIIGVSLSILPIFVLLLALLIYDFISVYKTKHMLTLAGGMMDMKLPILFVVPKHLGYSYIKDDFSDKDIQPKEDEAENENKTESKTENKTEDKNENKEEPVDEKKERGALFMGLGDAVIPTLLVVSANHFIPHDGIISIPALLTMAGTFVGFAALMYVVSKGNPQAGLPFLNTGAMAGFLIGVFVSGISVMSFLPF
ncbi:presenilin family intramembrane aspartyl protease PSH [Methanolapillus millepedarum]|uniref:Presenilin n=1 Tax=Methanolapillus millepedarum TaxID=3028296 RepID=A0AA96V457_9EURY|nr:hypothetical protein MsAc7_09260 [Methanosarcinaceae archaeon Ac7]